MSLDKETIKKVAHLAHIKMDEQELEERTENINGILQWIDQLGEVDTDNVEPLRNVANIELQLRKDEITDGGYAEEILTNAPEESQGFFVVPKVVE